MAQEMGIRVHAVQGRGYRLADSVEWLDPDRVAVMLGALTHRYHLQVVDVVDSTNVALMREAMAGIFPEVPIEVEGGVCHHWGEK
jgi:BirA family biotin operon repressor/biotin-[acetyl-CoA-carboxylase] ligase